MSSEPIVGPKGFVAGGVKAGLKPSGALDLGAIVCDRPAVAAGLTTSNVFCGAPVEVCRERLAQRPRLRGVVVNAGIANVGNGRRGLADARRMARLAEEAVGADEGEFLVASTGVIGPPLPMDRIARATPDLFASLASDGWGAFAHAIMTTDLVPKISHRRIPLGRAGEATVLGVAKGSGMIQPDMATMLAFVVTDYPLGPGRARQLLRRTADETFNRVTVDGDTSTSDTLLLFANGAAAARRDVTTARDRKFQTALGEVCEDLAQAIARDGEGATRLITVEVRGASNGADAERVARTVANSPLVKTAVFGADPNCLGRVCAAAGRAGVKFGPTRLSLRVQGRTMMSRGKPTRFDADAMARSLDAPEVTIALGLGRGPGRARIWTCDLSYDYVRINAEYTT